MKSILETSPFRILAESVSDAALYCQIAIDADWEGAWRVDPSTVPSDQDIADWLHGRGSAVAIEVFFPTGDGRLIYYGERLHSVNEIARVAFLSGFITTALSSDDAFAVVTRTLSKGEAATPYSLDIGVADWWSSLGNRQVWRAGATRAFAPEAVTAAIHTHPAIGSNTKNYQVLVLTLASQPGRWIGVDVSASISAPFRLSQERIQFAWGAFLG